MKRNVKGKKMEDQLKYKRQLIRQEVMSDLGKLGPYEVLGLLEDIKNEINNLLENYVGYRGENANYHKVFCIKCNKKYPAGEGTYCQYCGERLFIEKPKM